MMKRIQCISRMPDSLMDFENSYTLNIAESARRFHQSFPEYVCTPLAELKNLAQTLNVASIWVKDESARFGLNAFKALGGTYCIGKYISSRLNIPMPTFFDLMSPELHTQIQDLTFVTATDGNHGRGIAWAANRLGLKSVVYMPKNSSLERLNNIRALGSDASITDMNYDDTVRYACFQAEKNDWILVQDTSWDNYTEIPGWIMQGYTTMGSEILSQLNENCPTHIFLQAGVGAMAGAMTGFFMNVFKDNPPKICIVEPNEANCIFRSAQRTDGNICTVSGDLNTIMAGLACGEPCDIGWKIIKHYARNYASVANEIAAKGMRVLGNPLGDDPRIISGESGAAAFGFAVEVLLRNEYNDIKTQLELDETSQLLFISTEGDTDRDNYRRIVWDGAYSS